MRTFGSALDESRGVGPGFEFLRVALSLSILFTHSFLIAEGELHQFSGPLLGIFHDSLLPMFFALSGFLITGSALRLRLKDFLLNRAIRIVPALAVDIFLSAIIIGPIFTTVPLRDYVTAYEFRAYFANILGIIHYILPGVFDQNPFPHTVNGSLWTIPFEIGCYIIMSAMIVFGLLRRPLLSVVFAASLSAIICYSILTGLDPLLTSSVPWLRGPVRTALSHFFVRENLGLYIYFVLGALAYLFRFKIPSSALIAGGCACALVAAAASLPTISPDYICAIGSPLIVYITVQIGMTKFPKLPIFRHGDYSYGIYLYGYPLQQCLVTLFPSLTSPWAHFAASVPVVLAAAMTSWHFIEKPILNLRKRFSFTARKGDDIESLPEAGPAASPSSA